MKRGIWLCIEVHGIIHGCMVRYRGAWRYTWMYGDVSACIIGVYGNV